MIDVGVKNEAEVEDKLIARIFRVRNNHRVSQYRVLSIWCVNGQVAIAKSLPWNDVLVKHVKINKGDLVEPSTRAQIPAGDWATILGPWNNISNWKRVRWVQDGPSYLLEGRTWRKRCLESLWALRYDLLLTISLIYIIVLVKNWSALVLRSII